MPFAVCARSHIRILHREQGTRAERTAAQTRTLGRGLRVNGSFVGG